MLREEYVGVHGVGRREWCNMGVVDNYDTLARPVITCRRCTHLDNPRLAFLSSSSFDFAKD